MDKNTYEKAIFVIATYCLYLILINLIIAYMSDSYKTVMENLHQRDNREINTQILEMEKLMFWSRTSINDKYLYILDYSIDKASLDNQ